MEKIFEDYKGVIIFYALVMIMAILFTMRMDKINSQAQNIIETNRETYYA